MRSAYAKPHFSKRGPDSDSSDDDSPSPGPPASSKFPPSGAFPRCEYSQEVNVSDMLPSDDEQGSIEGGALLGDGGDEGMVRSDEAEATRRHLHRKKGKVYLLQNTVNGKQYVGQTIQRPSARMRQHAGGKQKGRARSGKETIIQRAIEKYGWHAFEFRILESNIEHGFNGSVLDERERWWIREMGTLTPAGYNMDAGGQKGAVWTKELREKQSVAMKKWASSEEVRARKREVWATPGFKQARSAERKVIQNEAENVQSRRDTWDAKRTVRIGAIEDPKQRRKAIHQARNQAKQGVRKAFRRGVEGRDLWAEFYARWGSDEDWDAWLKSGSCDPPRGCPL